MPSWPGPRFNGFVKVIGLTGGIGMGKSTAARWLQGRQIPVVDTDELARRVVEPGQPALDEIRREFGDKMVGPDGSLLREELARVVFADPSARHLLERITHPCIKELWMRQIAAWRNEARPLAVVVIPLLFETNAESSFDLTLCLACSDATQQIRLAQRGWSSEQIHQRLSAQWPIARKITRADYVIWTESGFDVTAAQFEQILRSICESQPDS